TNEGWGRAFTLRLREPNGWVVNTGVTIIQSGSSRLWSDGTVARSCKDYRLPPTGHTYAGATGDGIYTIDPDGGGSVAPFDAYCDMTTDGGGWTRVANISSNDIAVTATTYQSGMNTLSNTNYVVPCGQLTPLGQN